MKTANQWHKELTAPIAHSKWMGEPCILSPSDIRDVQADALKWAAEQIITDGNPDIARAKILAAKL